MITVESQQSTLIKNKKWAETKTIKSMDFQLLEELEKVHTQEKVKSLITSTKLRISFNDTCSASKIKESLIQKAKVKKQYANVLKKEGRDFKNLPNKKSQQQETKPTKTSISDKEEKKSTTNKDEKKNDVESNKLSNSKRNKVESRNYKNQPNLNDRMNVMLDKVKKTVS